MSAHNSNEPCSKLRFCCISWQYHRDQALPYIFVCFPVVAYNRVLHKFSGWSPLFKEHSFFYIP